MLGAMGRNEVLVGKQRSKPVSKCRVIPPPVPLRFFMLGVGHRPSLGSPTFQRLLRPSSEPAQLEVCFNMGDTLALAG